MFMYQTHFYHLECPYPGNLLGQRHHYMPHHPNHPITCFILQFFSSSFLTQTVQVFSVTFKSTVTCSSICKSLPFSISVLITNSSFISLLLTFLFEGPIIFVCTEPTFHVFVSNFLTTSLKTRFIFLPTLRIVICLTKKKIVDLMMVFVYDPGKIKDSNFITLTDVQLLRIHIQLPFNFGIFYFIFLKD